MKDLVRYILLGVVLIAVALTIVVALSQLTGVLLLAVSGFACLALGYYWAEGFSEPKRVNGHTLEEVVGFYIQEMDSPYVDIPTRQAYRDWLREFIKEENGTP